MRSILKPAIAVIAAVLAASLPLSSAAPLPDDEKTIVHVLNRIGYGARPGDVERIRGLGLQKYLEQQLHPETIADSGMGARVAHLTTVELSSGEISRQYEQPMIEARRQRQQAAARDSGAGNQPPLPLPGQRPANGVLLELSQHKLLRAIYSERQLQEVLTDFWFNHFNVDARKGRDRFLLTEYEREAIRPHVLGTFRDLLGATAASPAMLFYLDNWLSAAPVTDVSRATASGRRAPRGRPGFRGPMPAMPQAPPQGNRRRGLNENYARELMELHTLGVDGGYTQKDVTEVARAFTGWTIDNPRQGASFRFDGRSHDEGEKTVLGRRIKAGGGRSDGEQVLDILAAHPSTARHISTKLARRFVSDTPPQPLVDRLASRFAASQGDLRAVLTTLLTSPEFLAPEAYRAKVKSPLEFVVSAVRATGVDITDARPLVRSIQELGMPLYQCQPPTGYGDTADAWTNAGALVNRMNFALALASGPGLADFAVPGRGRSAQDGGVDVERRRESASRAQRRLSLPAPGVDSWLVSIETALAHDISETTRSTTARAASAQERIALLLGSPDFQRK
jgi:uncharacterized protein (DUF1800 family)